MGTLNLTFFGFIFHLLVSFYSETLFGGDEVWDTALLYGFSLKPSSFYVSAGIGIAIVGGWRCETCGLHLFGDTGNDEKKKIGPRIGLPLEMQVFFRPSSPFYLRNKRAAIFNMLLSVTPARTIDNVGRSPKAALSFFPARS